MRERRSEAILLLKFQTRRLLRFTRDNDFEGIKVHILKPI